MRWGSRTGPRGGEMRDAVMSGSVFVLLSILVFIIMMAIRFAIQERKYAAEDRELKQRYREAAEREAYGGCTRAEIEAELERRAMARAKGPASPAPIPLCSKCKKNATVNVGADGRPICNGCFIRAKDAPPKSGPTLFSRGNQLAATIANVLGYGDLPITEMSLDLKCREAATVSLKILLTQEQADRLETLLGVRRERE